jgi:hypothetical protein
MIVPRTQSHDLNAGSSGAPHGQLDHARSVRPLAFQSRAVCGPSKGGPR